MRTTAEQTKKIVLQRLNNIIITVGFESISAMIHEEFSKANVVPTELHFGVSLPSYEEIFRKCDWWDLPEGLMCSKCYNQVSNLFLSKDFKKRVCDTCVKDRDQQVAQSHEVSLKLLKYSQFTTNSVNHIAFVGRQSRGRPLSNESFEILKEFSRNWSDFPLRTTSIQNDIGNFGGNGSALAVYSAMNTRLLKNSNGNTFLPLSELIARLSCFYRPGLDHITIVFYTFTALSVKAQNLLRIILDLQKANIPKQNINNFSRTL
ncbi:hypothetical protein OUZ56_007233 [Daphnia magna]|uniref:Uncharacterized protein n=1 Tax=Daphnia magna TaxID=35525 RepID=A0ABQ9YY01_9CRUS|nr:hypothetical protein OUZ56_007233 [Daphnia magna]